MKFFVDTADIKEIRDLAARALAFQERLRTARDKLPPPDPGWYPRSVALGRGVIAAGRSGRGSSSTSASCGSSRSIRDRQNTAP